MSPAETSSIRHKRTPTKRKFIVAVVILAITGGILAFYAWDYRPQTLVNYAGSISESHSWTMNVDLFFGDRSMQFSVETLQIPIFLTLWWQSGTNAFVYLQSQPVAVNSTWTMTVTIHNSGGQYNVLIAKSENYGEGLTAIYVTIRI